MKSLKCTKSDQVTGKRQARWEASRVETSRREPMIGWGGRGSDVSVDGSRSVGEPENGMEKDFEFIFFQGCDWLMFLVPGVRP